MLSKGLAFAAFWTLWFGFENKAWIAPKYPIYLKNNKHVKNTIQWKAAGRSQQRKKTYKSYGYIACLSPEQWDTDEERQVATVFSMTKEADTGQIMANTDLHSASPDTGSMDE